MKKIFCIVISALIAYCALVFLSKPVLKSLLKHKIEHSIAGSKVSGTKIKLHYSPWSLLLLKASADIAIDTWQQDKIKAKNIKAHVSWKGGNLYLDSLTGGIFNGAFQGQGRGQWAPAFKYDLGLIFYNLDLARFVQDFELDKRFLLVGFLNGKLLLNGTDNAIHILNGEFFAPVSGGDLKIMDTQFLENMAAGSKLPANVVVDSFKNYHYNKGLVEMFLNRNDLDFNVSLEGAGGQRNLKVIVHDFHFNEQEEAKL